MAKIIKVTAPGSQAEAGSVPVDQASQEVLQGVYEGRVRNQSGLVIVEKTVYVPDSWEVPTASNDKELEVRDEGPGEPQSDAVVESATGIDPHQEKDAEGSGDADATLPHLGDELKTEVDNTKSATPPPFGATGPTS